MADKSISELVPATSVTSTDLFVLEQSGTAKKLSGSTLIRDLAKALDGHGGITSIAYLSSSGLKDTYKINLADNTTFEFDVTNGRSITSITQTSEAGLTRTYTIAFNDNSSQTFTVKDGRSITKISKLGTNGLKDIYRISYNEGDPDTFEITNGAKGDNGDNAYIWIKYASQEPTESSHSIGDIPDDWIGIYSGNASTAPADWNQYKWFQIKGEKGDTGSPATLVTQSVTYQVSDSGTITPSGEWGSSIPVVPQGKYLWTKTEIKFNSGNSIISYSVTRMGLDGTGSVSSVNNVSPNDAGNVSLTADDVGALPSSGGVMTGQIDMNGQPISGLNAPTNDTQVANKGYVDASVRKAAPRNLLDNSDFRNPVNQRGKNSYTGNVHTIDRWRIGNSSSTCTVGNGYVSYSASGGASFPRQIIEPTADIAGKTLTAAVCTRDGLIAITSGVFPAETVSEVTRFTPAVTISEGVTFSLRKAPDGTIDFLFRIDDGKSLALRWAALYEGEYTAETLPEYQPKGYAAELAECLRYTRKLTAGYVFRGDVVSANSVQATIPLGIPMRVTPSIADGEFSITNLAASSQNGFTFTVSLDGYGFVRITGAKTAHGLSDAALRVASDVILSADL